jgi:VanZ family protein
LIKLSNTTRFWIRLAKIALASYWLFLFVATHLPSRQLPRQVPSNDKLAHFTAYLILSFLLAVVATWKLPAQIRTYAGIFAVTAVYAAIDELLQIPVPGRTGDVWDFTADMLGSLAGLAIFHCLTLITGWRRLKTC